jgi:NADH-quinone oxidoreductase subunit M
MYFLIAIYGGENRARAATKFFIFTFTGSMITLAGLLYIAWQCAVANGVALADGTIDPVWSFDIPTLTAFASTQLSATEQAWLLLALMAGFAIKVPLFPVHTWLPLAHTEAPTAGSVILAAVLLKLGTYGLYRFVLPMLPVAVVEYAPFIAVLSIIGIIYAALICWVQDDIKKLIAYSSVSHLGFCVLGLFALNPMGGQGSVLYMLNHGLSTGALFFLVGMIYERYHTRDMNRMSGLSKRMPVWAFFMVFFVLSSVGLPGLNGFVSEFLCLIAAFVASPDATDYPGVLGPWYAAVAALGMVFAAMYLLIMVGKVVFGPLKEPPHDHDHEDGPTLPADLTWREIGVLAPLAVLCVYIGFQPAPLTDAIEAPIENAIAAYPDAVRAHLAEGAGADDSALTRADAAEEARTDG